ncbi:MAG: matrixin family metalloprotease [Oligoflexales bacterium]
MMSAIRYVFTCLTAGVVFAQFVACGSSLYQVSLDEDSHMEASNTNAADPSSNEYGIHARDGWTNLPVSSLLSVEMMMEQKVHLYAAMLKWEWAVGRKLFRLDGNTAKHGDDFVDLYSSLNDQLNGHYLDLDWEKTAKKREVLATTIWSYDTSNTKIATADIRFNEEYYLIGDSLKTKASETKEVVDMQSLALHELGHLLGLAHVGAEEDEYSIMRPSMFIGEGLSNRTLSAGDIERIQKIYGCEGDACNIELLLSQQVSGEADFTVESVNYFKKTNLTLLP